MIVKGFGAHALTHHLAHGTQRILMKNVNHLEDEDNEIIKLYSIPERLELSSSYSTDMTLGKSHAKDPPRTRELSDDLNDKSEILTSKHRFH